MPYIRRFWGTTMVLKYGGAAMTSPRLQEQFAEDIVLLRARRHEAGGRARRRPRDQPPHGQLGMEPELRRRAPGHRRGDAWRSPRWSSSARSTRRSSGSSTATAAPPSASPGEDGRLLKVDAQAAPRRGRQRRRPGFVGEVDRGRRERARPARRGQYPGRGQRRRRRATARPTTSTPTRSPASSPPPSAPRRSSFSPTSTASTRTRAPSRRRSPSATSPISGRCRPPGTSPAA